METRDIIVNGVKVGELTLPAGTAEDVWSKALAKYQSKTVITPVTPVQMRKALVLSGIPIASVDDALATLDEPLRSLATIEWEYALEFDRYNTTADFVAQSLGWTSSQVDDLWTMAATL